MTLRKREGLEEQRIEQLLTGQTVTDVSWDDAAAEGGLALQLVSEFGVRTLLVLGFTELGMWVERSEELP
jgi:hypothetical protein